MSRLVVLGGSDGTVSAFRAARRIGLATICVDMRPDAPGVAEADEFLHVSTRDVPAVAAALRGRADLAGLLAPGSDINLPSLVELARTLGLPCALTDATLRASTDKLYFRQVCERLGLPGPRYATDPALRPPLPVIVKPVDSGSSRGITICREPGAVPAAMAHAADVSPSGRVIIEELLTGQDLCAEAMLQDGRVALLGLSRRVTAPPEVVAIGHDMAPGADVLEKEVVRQLELVCGDLGYRDGPLNVDLFVDDGRVTLVEMGARIGGNGLGEALGLMHGVDTVEAAVRLAVGERPDLTPARRTSASVRVLRAPVAGTLVAVEGLESLPDSAEVVMVARPGEQVVPYTECRAKLGYVVDRVPPDLDALIRVDVR
ncbi:ATP-grasp domain-containing protein [Nonomuraea sp. MG754425]|uniref:ATP-grasp domain-containing protein n=1 Tax=Nonomuraea sp. MG754425 TaxID=2570319 RepID=UPI001F1D84FE|nr:ATP-grasp domain-containing protein [Nonomuraea sp. MG754425]MCF6473324.1 ATP-grasp domain-containing protein [Nonomuraea sp. MG754425]